MVDHLRVVLSKPIHFLKSMSERVGYDIERPWIFNDTFCNLYLHRLKIHWIWPHSNSVSFHVGSDFFRDWFQKRLGFRLSLNQKLIDSPLILKILIIIHKNGIFEIFVWAVWIFRVISDWPIFIFFFFLQMEFSHGHFYWSLIGRSLKPVQGPRTGPRSRGKSGRDPLTRLV